MSKREARGQMVKTFGHYVPQPDQTSANQIIKVYFKADNGQFYIYPPDHLLPVAKTQAEKTSSWRNVQCVSGAISATTVDAVINAFTALTSVYKTILKEANKERVIRFISQRNLPGESRTQHQISFCASPALHFSYEVLWSSGGHLYRQSSPDMPLEHVSSHIDGDGTVIPWTQEREDFFASMHDAMIRLIERLSDFEANLVDNIDKAITTNSSLFLPAPGTAGGYEQ